MVMTGMPVKEIYRSESFPHRPDLDVPEAEGVSQGLAGAPQMGRGREPPLSLRNAGMSLCRHLRNRVLRAIRKPIQEEEHRNECDSVGHC
jgi:hypothetical protein